MLVVLHPCSVARRLDQQISHRRSTRSVAGLAATLAHEVKNPLSGIRGAAQLLEPAVGEEDRPLIQLICDETDRICALVERMEEFGDTAPVERRSVNIYQVLEHVRRIAEAGFARHHRIVELYDPSLPEVEGDRDRLIQVFLNLVKNAAEATPAGGGPITLATQYQHGLRVAVNNSRDRLELPITVEVRDNGPGVALGHGRPPVRAVHQQQAPRQRPRPVAGGQDRGRPSRRRLLPARRARRHLPGAAARGRQQQEPVRQREVA